MPSYINLLQCFLPWAVGNASSGLSLCVVLEVLAKSCDCCVIAWHANCGERGCFPAWLHKDTESKAVFAKTVLLWEAEIQHLFLSVFKDLEPNAECQ